jgi:hypothetical protein
MEKQKIYLDVRFSPEVLRRATELTDSFIDKEQRKQISTQTRTIQLTETEKLSYDSDDEFFGDFRAAHLYSFYNRSGAGYGLDIYTYYRKVFVTINAPERRKIDAILEVFEENAEKCKLPPIPEQPKPKPCIFIGHGGSEQWKELKDHLHEKHEYSVVAYETGARAGHEIRDILEDMLDKASFAVLVMTGEDEADGGKMRARQNVIHELGLFQGRLGFTRSIVLLEEDTEEFSNLHGVQQIRYGKGNIKETFGEVLASLRREFGA